jgi:hypothetical protein
MAASHHHRYGDSYAVDATRESMLESFGEVRRLHAHPLQEQQDGVCVCVCVCVCVYAHPLQEQQHVLTPL